MCWTAYLLFLLSVCGAARAVTQDPPRIAVIGGGIGGAATAYFLTDLFGKDVFVDLFHDEDKFGGRLDSLRVDQRYFESGGSIIHDKNLYMKHFASKLNLETLSKRSGVKLAVLDGNKAVLDTSDWYIVKMLQLARAYGFFTFSNLKTLVNDIMNDFSNIYDLQNQGNAFTTVEGMLQAMASRFVNMTYITIGDFLKQQGFSQEFIDQIALGAMRSNYGQDLSIHAFVGAVSLAGADGSLWSVKGGNAHLVDTLVKMLSDLETVDSFHVTVNRIARANDSKWLLETSVGIQQFYDFVVLAAPLHHESKLEIENIQPPLRRYKRTVSNFVKGTLNSSFFGVSTSPNYSILSGGAEVFFRSIGIQSDVEGNPTDNIYKIFAGTQIRRHELDELFTQVDEYYFKGYWAYPEYKAGQPLGKFLLADNLIYLNAIEDAAAAMECSALAGRNAALLVHNIWRGLDSKIDPSGVKSSGGRNIQLKTEL